MPKDIIIQDCMITKTNSKLLKPFIYDVSSVDYNKYGKALHDGCDIECTEVFNLAKGVVVQTISGGNNKFSALIQYDIDQYFRYSNLTALDVSWGQAIDNSERVGVCKDYVHFEFLRATPNNNTFRYHLSTITLYKYDPYPFLYGYV